MDKYILIKIMVFGTNCKANTIHPTVQRRNAHQNMGTEAFTVYQRAQATVLCLSIDKQRFKRQSCRH